MEFTAEQQQAIWDGWREGESFQRVADRVGQRAHVIQYFLRSHGGIRPKPAHRDRRHLTHDEREEISRGIAAGWSLRKIATSLNRPHSTVSRELARNGGRLTYRAAAAEHAAGLRVKRPKVTRLRERPALLQVVRAKLELDWSPEQISAWLKKSYPDDQSMRLSHEAIYRSIYYVYRRELDRGTSQHLRSGRTVRRPRRRVQPSRRGRLKNMVPISARPSSVENRVEVGHWEGDLVMGKRPSVVATLVERSTRFLKIVPLPNGYKADAVRRALTAALGEFPEQVRRSLTWDRGREMAEHELLAQDLSMDVYFCAPASPWQRGSNENTNRLLRQYLIKGSDLRRFTPDELDEIAGRLNDRPRHVLDWSSSNDLIKTWHVDQAAPALISKPKAVH